jgi:hypothetical protein
MSFWTFVFLCVIAGLAYNIWNKRHLAEHGHTTGESGAHRPIAPAREAELQAELARLRERVQVLERIATDEARPRSLANEIEKLRDRD